MNTVRILATITAALLLSAGAAPAAAQGSTTEQVKEMLGNLWARLRAATPRSAPTAPATAVTAGLRGSEATESELKPYWKGDREQDPSSRNERVALESAQALADGGKFAEAAQAYYAFVTAHPSSTLVPNALFGA